MKTIPQDKNRLVIINLLSISNNKFVAEKSINTQTSLIQVFN